MTDSPTDLKDSRGKISPESLKIFNKYSVGFGFSGSFLFFFFVVPWIFVQFFKQGLEDLSLYVVLACLPFIFASYFVFKTPLKTRMLIRKIAGMVQIPLLFLLGLVVKFGIDERSITSLILVDLTLVFGFYITILDLQMLSLLSKQCIDAESKTEEFNNLILGVSIAIGINVVVWFIFPGFENLVFSTAVLHAIRMIAFTMQLGKQPGISDDSEMENLEKTGKTNKTEEIEKVEEVDKVEKVKEFRFGDLLEFNLLNMLKFWGNILIWILSLLIIMYATAEVDIETYSWPFLGVVIGLLIDRFLISLISRKTTKLTENIIRYVILYLGLAEIISLFAFNPTWLLSPLGLTFNGIFFGIASDILIKYYFNENHLFRNNFSRTSESILLVILLIGFGLLAHEMKFIVLDHVEFWSLLPIIAVGISIISFIFVIASEIGLEDVQSVFRNKFKTISEKFSSQWSFDAIKVDRNNLHLNNIKPKHIVAVSMIILMCSSISTIWLYSESSPYVHIELDDTMYTVYGEAVTEINLEERCGVILLNSPDPTGIVHDEDIREGKSIRLGAYLYDARAIGDLNMSQAVEWMGETLDVFSLGGFTNYCFWPEDVLTIKEINPRNRFYIMNFATTQGEFDNWTVDGDLSQYTANWNETKDSWTVKTNEGKEALGVRHTSDDCQGHLMDLGNMEWADYYAMVWDNRVKEYHADGVAIDEVMWKGYWNTDINNLRDYDSIDEITQTCYDWLERVDSKMETEVITQAFWDEAQEYQQGIWGELAFRCGGAYGNRVDDRSASVFYEDMDWEEIVNNMYYHSSNNRSYIWAAWYEREDMDALEYAVSTYLMGKANENTSLAFHPQPIYDGGYPYNLAGYSLDTVRTEINENPEFFDLEMGDALGPMELEYQNGNPVWKREFTNGIVYVNPFHAYVPGFDTPASYNPSH